MSDPTKQNNQEFTQLRWQLLTLITELLRLPLMFYHLFCINGKETIYCTRISQNNKNNTKQHFFPAQPYVTSLI